MAKTSGLGNALYVAGFDLSGETQQWAINGGNTPIDVTGIRQEAPERIGGLLTGHLKYVTHFDPVAATHLHLSTLPTGQEHVMMAHRETIGAPAACLISRQIGYDPTRGEGGAVTFSVDAESDTAGVDWAAMATAGKRVDTTATNGASVDHGAAPPGSFGMQAWLQVFAFTGTSVTIKVQQSSDDGVGDAFADVVGGSFGAITAVGAAKLATSRTQAVERYLRVVTSGTFTTVTFAVAVSINDTAVPL
jgi:hypothetical protein